MSKGKAIFAAVCDAPDAEAAVAGLPLKQWRRLYSYLLRTCSENGVSGHVLSLMLVNAAARLTADENAREDASRQKTREVLG